MSLPEWVKVVDLFDVSRFVPEYYHPELEKFKDIHKGKRCFLVGTGPSLRIDDLEILHKNNEICFSCNGIFNLYDKTEWRPDYYVVVDPSFFSVLKNKYSLIHAQSTIFIKDEYNYSKDFRKSDFQKANYIHMIPGMGNYNHPPFSFDISELVVDAETVIFSAMQIAAYMGFDEIILLGIDNSQGLNITSHFYDERELGYISNGRFICDYSKKKHRTIRDLNHTFECLNTFQQMNRAFESAGRYMSKNRIRLLNATRGGRLETVDRISFDSIFVVDDDRE